MSKLNETHNFIKLYLHHVGRSEVPELYHLWCAVSLVSACVADRVWYEKFVGKKLAPNLYVMLIGEPGTGKDTAIEYAIKYVSEIPRVNLLYGKATAPYIVDYLSKARKGEGKTYLENTKLYLATPELAMSVGSGSLADMFVKFMTAVYGGGSVPIHEGTRMHGGVVIRNSCFNWLAGTTRKWLTNTVTRDAIEGGFFARFAVVTADYSPELRIRQPTVPHDYEEVSEHLRRRVRELTCLGGKFDMSPEAERIDEQWYTTRASPQDESLLPAWKRQHDLVIKLSMVLSLAEGNYDFIIRSEHIRWAQALTAEIYKTLPPLMAFASATRDTEHLDLVARLIKQSKQIPRFLLMRQASSRGVHKMKLDEAVEALVQQKKIVRAPGAAGGVVYQWIDSRRRLSIELDPSGTDPLDS